jgi:hypothetical protein
VDIRIDPILIATVCITIDFESKRRDRLELFLAKLTNGKAVQYYARHIKNLAIFGGFSKEKEVNGLLAICTGVKTLYYYHHPATSTFLKTLSLVAICAG